jgi:putative hydrolases of HD superfamily
MRPVHGPPMPAEDLDALHAFFRAVEPLKDTLRSGSTSGGRRESTAEHTWRLCLIAVTLQEVLPEIDHLRLLQMLVIHDLG